MTFARPQERANWTGLHVRNLSASNGVHEGGGGRPDHLFLLCTRDERFPSKKGSFKMFWMPKDDLGNMGLSKKLLAYPNVASPWGARVAPRGHGSP